MAVPLANPDETGGAALLAAVARLAPAMDGAYGPPGAGWVAPGLDNEAALRRLHDALAASHPEAGPAFWALRTWGWLIWQPAMLAVYAVHGAGAVPAIAAMSQPVGQAAVIGFRLPDAAAETGDPPRLVLRAGSHLRALAETLLADLGRVVRIKPVIARRLLADRLMSTLLHLQERLPGLSNGALRAHAAAWLAATGLEGMSGLCGVVPGDGRARLVVARRACCLDYLRRGGSYCGGCPKLCVRNDVRRPADRP